ncbi:endonuclease/exonuclease/phosphatase family protein [Limnoglobus roseus]|uniref:Endonuclease/exonuclease/phosphatase domain-containing protein n=1 Tax=Limnoglobus roseus TaxID=2598579 RepID=A0A5C1AIH7_9BACT|nr:endonuclease/exonuclease/phosphatase family protein [Limnoglobus roseus]QEL18455.1 hypothetical protein PX52LOC_05480 [Limnoglobus roseus]
MARTKALPVDTKVLLDYFLRLPRRFQVAIVAIAAVGCLLYFSGVFNKVTTPPTSPGDGQLGEMGELTPVNADVPAGQRELFFCFWNVENLFDDKNDNRRSVDEEFDNAFADNTELRQLKLDHLATTILKMNDGKGPDVLACVELESVRALELLQGTLNAKITDPKMKYVSLAMKNLDAGRHIAPGVLSRYPLSQQRTKMIGSRLRILETHLFINNQDLCIVASHWTSKLKQMGGGNGEEGREKYARGIYGVFKQMVEKNPDADFLLCGDFNDTPDSEEVADVLHGTDDVRKVKAETTNPYLLDLLAGKSPDKFGTIFYGGKPLIYDHICVSRGMLDEVGWSCDPTSVQTYTDGLRRTGATRREPWRFGSPGQKLRDSERGFSDHFPVTVKLTVRTPTPKQ